jgi:hypothetical protein
MFNPLSAFVVARILAAGLLPPRPRAIDMGNQTWGVGREALERIAALLAPQGARLGVDPGALRSLATARAPHVGLFYQALGFGLYEAIDINSRDDTLVMDLNTDLRADYGFTRTYDLVLNTGTSEHVFNQAAFLKNAHALAAPEAVMAHVVPFTGYVNHGFFNYQPGLFLDLAAANGYRVVSLEVADREGVLLDLMQANDVAAHFLHFVGLTTRNERGNTFLVAVLKKQSDAAFVIPCQGKYIATIEEKEVSSRYAGQAGGDDASRPRLAAAPAPRPGTLRRRIKKALLKALRRTSHTVLTRL